LQDKANNIDQNKRRAWAANRCLMEASRERAGPCGYRSGRNARLAGLALRVGGVALKSIGLFQRGCDNAFNLAFRQMDLLLPSLDEALDGYGILHLSDLHLDGMDELAERIIALLPTEPVDLCVITGDFGLGADSWDSRTLKSLAGIIESISSRDGIIGVLGNHDSASMVPALESIGIRMLINESMQIERGPGQMTLIGTDDVHFYYTPAAVEALGKACEGFSIALVHSPELYAEACEAGVDLYLCGHTHGGQVCLPGGKGIVRNLCRGQRFYKGHWHHGRMQGVTHCGVGTSGLPIRFNSRGELLYLRLRCRQSQHRS